MKLVEEAAREIWKRNGTEDEWGDLNEDTKESWRNQARAILALFLAALRREPSEGMLEVGALELPERYGAYAAPIWSAMVAERVREWGE